MFNTVTLHGQPPPCSGGGGNPLIRANDSGWGKLITVKAQGVFHCPTLCKGPLWANPHVKNRGAEQDHNIVCIRNDVATIAPTGEYAHIEGGGGHLMMHLHAREKERGLYLSLSLSLSLSIAPLTLTIPIPVTTSLPSKKALGGTY